MKIRSFFEIEDGVYICRIKTEDWSENDQNLIMRFGEPEIDLGGEITVYSEITGSHDGTDGSTTLQDSVKTWVADAHIGRVIRRDSDSVSSAIAGNTTNTLTTADSLAWATGTPAYTIFKVSFLLPVDYRRVRSESPFVHKFDSRDYTATSLVNYTVPEALRPTAKVMANAWAAELSARIEAAVTALRTNSDSYTREKVETI